MDDQSYIYKILVWLDNGINVWFAPLLNKIYSTDKFGDPDECISSILGKLQVEGQDTRFRKAVDWVFLKLFNQENHCINNIEYDEGKQIIKE